MMSLPQKSDYWQAEASTSFSGMETERGKQKNKAGSA
jgi:hypothetical protein